MKESKELTPGQKIKIALIKMDLNQNEFSAKIGMHYSTLSGIIIGKLNPTYEQRKKIVEGIGCRMKTIFKTFLGVPLC